MATTRTLFVHSGALGDFILTLSIVQAIAESRAAPVTLLARGEFAPMAALHRDVDRLIDINRSPWHQLFGDEPREALEAIRETGPFDLIVDVMGISAAAGAGFERTGVGRVIRFDPRPAPGDRRHITEQWATKLRSAGLPLPELHPPVLHTGDLQAMRPEPKSESGSKRNRTEIRETGRPDDRALVHGIDATPAAFHHNNDHDGPFDGFVVIHFGSGGLAKCWPLDRFIDVARRLQNAGHHIIFPIGPAEDDRAEVDAARPRLGEIGMTLDAPTIDNLVTLLASARCYIGNDSGPTHLAAALGRPVVAIFGPTDARVWAPRGPHVTIAGCGESTAGNSWPTVAEVVNDVAMTLNSS